MKLYQFTHCVFCEKVRLILAAKRLSYTVVEVLPGLGQWIRTTEIKQWTLTMMMSNS